MAYEGAERAMTTKTPRSPGELETLRVSVAEMTARLVGIHADLREHANRALGNVPEADQTPTNKLSALPSGGIEDVRAALHILDGEMESVGITVQRFARL